MKKFIYINNSEYDKEFKKIDCFKDIDDKEQIVGVVKHGKSDKQIGRIELKDKEYKVFEKDSYKKLFYTNAGYIQVGENEYLELVKVRALIIFLTGLIGTLVIGGLIAGYVLSSSADDDIPLTPDDNAEYVGTMGYDLGGYIVNEDDEALVGAKIKLMTGNTVLAEMTSNDTGSFMYRNVPSGYYMLVVEYNGKVHTKLVAIEEAAETVKFVINTNEGSSEVVINDDKPNIAIGDVDDAAKKLEKNIKVSYTPVKNLTDAAYAAMPDALKDGSVKLEYDVFQTQAYVNDQKVEDVGEVFELVIPFVTSNKTAFTVYRFANGVGDVLTEATTKADGTYYTDDEYVHIFSAKFNQFALVYGEENGTVTQSTTVGFEQFVNVDLASGTAKFFFYHNGAGVSAVLDLIAYDANGEEVVLMTTGAVGDGYKLETSSIDTSRLQAGNYTGLLRARYANTNGSVMNTNIDMPVTIIVK